MSISGEENEKRRYFVSFSKTFTYLLFTTISNMIDNLDVKFEDFDESLITSAIRFTEDKVKEMSNYDLQKILDRYGEKSISLDNKKTYISDYPKFMMWMKNRIDRTKFLEKMKNTLENQNKNHVFLQDIYHILCKIHGYDIFSRLQKKKRVLEIVESEPIKKQKCDFFERFYYFISKHDLHFYNNKLYSIQIDNNDPIIQEMSSHHFTYEIINNTLFFRHPILCPVDLEGAKYLDALLN